MPILPRYSLSLGLGLLLANVLPAPAQDTTITLQTLHVFRGIGDGAAPVGGLVPAKDGNYYGTTYAGGTNGATGGTIFRFSPGDGILTTITSFDKNAPRAPLTEGLDGRLYGTTTLGGSGDGILFRLTLPNSLQVLSTFDRTKTGYQPYAGLTRGQDGYFYGTTTGDGPAGGGTFFRLSPTGDLSVVHDFSATKGEGTHVLGKLVLGRDGDLYGTAAADGAHGSGTVFRISTLGSLDTVYDFTGGADGGNPRAGLLPGGDGSFYGTTSSGGAEGRGTVFRVTPQGELTTLHTFTAANADGAQPLAPLIDGNDGSLYGTTSTGGAGNSGTIFAVKQSGDFTTLHAFTGGAGGAAPTGALTSAGNGIFYGTTSAGGVDNPVQGTLFKLNLRTPPEIPGTLAFAAAVTPVSEGVANATLLINRTGGTTGTVGVRYATADSTAQAGVDYQAVSGAVSWRDGDDQPKAVVVPIVDRGLSDHSTRIFSVMLSAPTGGALLGPVATAGVSILEDDPPFVPTVTLSVVGDGTATVGGDFARVLFSRDGDTTEALTVHYQVQGKARNGVDYEALPGVLTIPAGKTRAKLKIKPKANAPHKGTFNVKILPTAPTDDSYRVEPSKVKVRFVNP